MVVRLFGVLCALLVLFDVCGCDCFEFCVCWVYLVSCLVFVDWFVLRLFVGMVWVI